jgi:murein DD-endopeptidase MepM/ murein hydrolase activator NlpD
MSQSQEFISRKNSLKKTEQVNRPDENLELSANNNNSRMRRELMEEAAYTAYDSVEHHKTFQKQQKAYNEVREQYEEQAYSSEDRYAQQHVTQPGFPEQEKSPPENGQPAGPGENPAGSRSAEGGADDYGREAGNSAEFIQGGAESPAWKSPTIQEVESRESGGITFGTAETPKLAKNSRALSENEKLQQRLESRRKDIQKGYTRFSAGEHSTNEKVRLRYYGRLDLTGEAELAHLGRLKYTGRITREKMTRDEYEKLLNRRGRKSFKRRTKGRLLFHGIKTITDEETLSEDELTASMKRNIRRTGRVAMAGTRRNIRTIKSQNNIYARLDQTRQREQVLRDKRERLLSDAKKKERKKQLRDEKSREQKKKLKKQMVQLQVQEEGNFFRRTKQGILIKRRAKKVRKQAVKRTMSTIFALAGIGVFFFIICIILFLVLIAVFVGSSEYYASAVTQNDYGTITDATEYFRKLETDLDEYLNADREALEEELEAEHGPDIYEYVYQLADFGFSANTLIAYLSAVYGSFTLEDVKEELQSVFEEMYTLTIEVKEEDREVSSYNPDTGDYENVTEPKKICYIILEKKELEEVVEPRMTPEQMELYKNYRLSTGGQQVYGPVMREDWTNLISSNFGVRIHPITKERKEHNGVDIAVPIGTHLYSAVDGTVILAAYSESAGNWVKVQTDTGWTVIFMHMDSLTVSTGQQVRKGDHLGYSGNTGRSTGPHLHLEVRNPDDKPLNPIFIIPQTCAQRGSEE